MDKSGGVIWLDDLFANYGLENIQGNNRVMVKAAIRQVVAEIIGTSEVMKAGYPGHNLDVGARNGLRAEQHELAGVFLGHE